MFVYKVFRTGGDTLLAIADAHLLGERLTDERFDIVVSKDFYMAGTCDAEEALKLARRATIINAIGRNIIKLLQEKRMVDEKNVLLISGVPHAQIIVV